MNGRSKGRKFQNDGADPVDHARILIKISRVVGLGIASTTSKMRGSSKIASGMICLPQHVAF